HRDAADPDRTFFADDGDAAFQIFRIGQHRDVHRAERARPPSDIHDAGILDLSIPAERRGIGLHALYGADEPIEQIDVVARLVHECTAVELPGPTPRRAVVILLRPRPEDIDVDHVDSPEALFLDRALEELQ